jgi:hypothetical protein
MNASRSAAALVRLELNDADQKVGDSAISEERLRIGFGVRQAGS